MLRIAERRHRRVATVPRNAVMPARRVFACGSLFVLVLGLACFSHAEPAKPLEFVLTFDRAISAEPFTGRVLVMLSEQANAEPRFGPDWFSPQPFFALDVKDWKPGENLVFGAESLGFPGPLAKLRPATYTVQAVMDLDQGERNFSNAEGNGYSVKQRLELDPDRSGRVPL